MTPTRPARYVVKSGFLYFVASDSAPQFGGWTYRQRLATRYARLDATSLAKTIYVGARIVRLVPRLPTRKR